MHSYIHSFVHLFSYAFLYSYTKKSDNRAKTRLRLTTLSLAFFGRKQTCLLLQNSDVTLYRISSHCFRTTVFGQSSHKFRLP